MQYHRFLWGSLSFKLITLLTIICLTMNVSTRNWISEFLMTYMKMFPSNRPNTHLMDFLKWTHLDIHNQNSNHKTSSPIKTTQSFQMNWTIYAVQCIGTTQKYSFNSSISIVIHTRRNIILHPNWKPNKQQQKNNVQVKEQK